MKCEPAATATDGPGPPAIVVPATDADKLHQVFMWIIQGGVEHDIKQAIEATWPGTEPMPLITQIIANLTAKGELETQAVRGWCFEANRELYRKMVDIGDFAGALRAVKQIYDLTKS